MPDKFALPSICPVSFRDRFRLSAMCVYQDLTLSAWAGRIMVLILFASSTS
jgi:hypothetical protein